MFKNYLKSAFRNIFRNKFYSLLNILGLSVGLAAFIFLFLFVKDEMTYDSSHKNADRIYRIESDFNISGNSDQFAIVPIPMAPALKIEYPEVESFVRFSNIGRTLFSYNEKEYYEEDFYYVDSTLFDIFTHKVLIGDPKQCLVEPNSVVLTQSSAERYFGKGQALGEMIMSASGRNYKVTAIIEDLARNSHLKFDGLISGTTLIRQIGEDDFNSLEPNRFWNIGVFAYVLLNENSSMQSIHDKFPGFYDKYMKPIGDQINASFNLMSTPLKQQHFSPAISSDLPKGSISYIYIFSAVAIFILLLAAINYMNMATARSAKRAREVGIRKVLGAFKGQLIWQFIGESVLIALMALIIALFCVFVFLNDFNNLSGKMLEFDLFTNPLLLLLIFGVTIFIGVVAGSYPAFYLSSFQPVKVLKGTLSSGGKKGGVLRKVLVVFQFWIAIVMIIGTFVVSDQIGFLLKKDVGFEKENMVILGLQDTAFRRKAESFKKELVQSPNIQNATNTTGVPGENGWIQVVRIESDTAMIDKTMIITVADYDYLETYGIELAQGRNFDRKMGTDAEEAVIVNEAAVKMHGWGDNPIGKKIHWGFAMDGTGGRLMKVVGVVKDYNFKSLHNKVEPLMIFLADFPKYYLSVKVSGDNLSQSLDFIGDKWREYGANRPFDYRLLDESWDEMYEAEKKLGTIFRIATLLTIFVALLGLLGLSSFVAEQKTREIGIRKVMGASIENILGLLYKEFLLLIGIAFIIAAPIAWWRLTIWLDTSFVYHTNVSWTSFLWAGLLSLMIGVLTLSYHSIRAATANPIDSIKYE
jgi:putative ABC transport system permease protein